MVVLDFFGTSSIYEDRDNMLENILEILNVFEYV